MTGDTYTEGQHVFVRCIGVTGVVDHGPENPRARWSITFRCGCHRWLSPTGLIRSPCGHVAPGPLAYRGPR